MVWFIYKQHPKYKGDFVQTDFTNVNRGYCTDDVTIVRLPVCNSE